MKNKKLFLKLLLLLLVNGVHGQTDSLFRNSEMAKISTATSNADWINIKPEIKLDPLTFFANNKKALALGTDDEMEDLPNRKR